MTDYDLGDSVRVTTEFKVNSVLTDPSTITFKKRSPDGVITTYVFGDGNAVIVKDAIGKFHADLLLLQSGVWSYRWSGTGTASAAEERQLRVKKSNFP